MLFTVAGCIMALNGIASNTMLQVQAPDRLRGREMGFYSFVVLGLAPLGSLQAGWVAEHFGVRTAIGAGGLVCLAVPSGSPLSLSVLSVSVFSVRGTLFPDPTAPSILAPC